VQTHNLVLTWVETEIHRSSHFQNEEDLKLNEDLVGDLSFLLSFLQKMLSPNFFCSVFLLAASLWVRSHAQLIDFYFEERLNVLRCLNQIFKIDIVVDFIYAEPAKEFLDDVLEKQEEFLERILGQLRQKLTENVPPAFVPAFFLASGTAFIFYFFKLFFPITPEYDPSADNKVDPAVTERAGGITRAPLFHGV